MYCQKQTHFPAKRIHTIHVNLALPDCKDVERNGSSRFLRGPVVRVCRILVEGFYDDVRNIAAEDKQMMEDFPFDESKDLAAIGASGPFGEPGFGTLERRYSVWAGPKILTF